MLNGPDETLEFKWNVRTDRFVGFIDIMGFKHFLTTLSSESLYEALAELRSNVLEGEKTVRTGNVVSEGRHIEFRAQLVRVACFSDSVVIVTRDRNNDSFMALLIAMMKAFLDLARRGIPSRGGIASGITVADFDNSIFFGQPIIDAYQLSESLTWYGIAMQHEHLGSGNDAEEFPEMTEEWIPLTLPCRVPTKGGVLDLCMINWPVFMNTDKDVKSLLAPFRNSSDAKLNGYYRNTLQLAQFARAERRQQKSKRTPKR